MKEFEMSREFRKIGEEYRKANQEGFTSLVRSMEDVSHGMQRIASEMTEYSKRSVGHALEIQRELASMAVGPFDTFLAQAETLQSASASGMSAFRNITNRGQRSVAQSVATQRKSGVVQSRTKSSKRKGGKSRRSTAKFKRKG
jgi:hypothetical protein